MKGYGTPCSLPKSIHIESHSKQLRLPSDAFEKLVTEKYTGKQIASKGPKHKHYTGEYDLNLIKLSDEKVCLKNNLQLFHLRQLVNKTENQCYSIEKIKTRQQDEYERPQTRKQTRISQELIPRTSEQERPATSKKCRRSKVGDHQQDPCFGEDLVGVVKCTKKNRRPPTAKRSLNLKSIDAQFLGLFAND